MVKIIISDVFIEKHLPELKQTPITVLLYLLKASIGNGLTIASIQEIANETGLSKTSVQSAIHRLAELKVISISKQATNRGLPRNVYQIPLKELDIDIDLAA